MKDQKASNSYQKAKGLYFALRQAEVVLRNHRKILKAIPKHKEKKYLRLLANAQVSEHNARNAFQIAAKKLKPEEFWKLRMESYL